MGSLKQAARAWRQQKFLSRHFYLLAFGMNSVWNYKLFFFKKAKTFITWSDQICPQNKSFNFAKRSYSLKSMISHSKCGL